MAYIDEYYRLVKNDIRNEVQRQTDGYLLSVDIDEYTAYLLDKYSLPLVAFDSNRQHTIDKERVTTSRLGDLGRRVSGEHLLARIELPVTPNKSIGEVLALMPSSALFSGLEMVYEHGSIVTHSGASVNEVDRAIQDVRDQVNRRNEDIQRCTKELKEWICQFLSSRVSKLQREEDLLDHIIQTVSVPLRRKREPSSVMPIPLEVKEKIRPVMPPKDHSPVEPRLEPKQFSAILSLIDNCCRMFERTPTTFSDMDEESLRDVTLSSLNGVFEGDAIGEAFSKLGKTDIHIKMSNGGIFIAECKHWAGPNTVGKAISQILGYLTWRYSYGVVVLFSNRKGFSRVVESLSEATRGAPNYVNGYEKLADAHFKAMYHLPEDEKKLVQLHLLAYNLYVERAA